MHTGSATYTEAAAFVTSAIDWWQGTTSGQGALYFDLTDTPTTLTYSSLPIVTAIQSGFSSLIAAAGGLASGYGGTVGQTAVTFDALMALELQVVNVAAIARSIANNYSYATTGSQTTTAGSASDTFAGTFDQTIVTMQSMLLPFLKNQMVISDS